ncbi:MAG: GNAT family N-acetyltransferase [Prolixibacteraceae bacterium]|jgi:RimJ/RimL family protein N-acetyltransferase|nr:GNAT family N-acetyltransferase [Prolixibacteraceae bacterium]
MVELTTGSIRLRGFSDLDQVRLAKLCNNKKIWDNVRDLLPSPYTEQNALEFIRLCQQEVPTTTFAIEYNGELAGCIGLVKQTDVYRLGAELGYWIGEPYWGLGIATQAVELITLYGFNKLGLIRIYSGVFEFNAASQRVLEKSGFKLEGIFEKSVIKDGKILNEYRYSKLKPQS